jgi:hypothetical protein
MSGQDALVSFWLAVALVLVTMVGAVGWLVALSLARDANEDKKAMLHWLRRLDAQRMRLSELRRLNHLLVDRVREAPARGPIRFWAKVNKAERHERDMKVAEAVLQATYYSDETGICCDLAAIVRGVES